VKTAVFWGCCILADQLGYEMSVRETFPRLGLELVDLRESVCCGDPVKSINDFATNYLGIRVLALTNQTGLHDLFVPCNRCHFTISEAMKTVRQNQEAGQKIRKLLEEEELEYNPDIKVCHTIDLLHDCLGLEKVKKTVEKPLKGLKMASHVGCQIIRYSDLGRIDDAENPIKLDELIRALGAEVVDYAEKLDCCGSALTHSHPDSALSLAGSKLKALQALKVDGLVVSCPDCGLMFDARQKDTATIVGVKLNVPVLYYTQLLGIAMGIDEKKLGLHLNQSPIDHLLAKISA
jgi:heterodisulfide reductase subunit B